LGKKGRKRLHKEALPANDVPFFSGLWAAAEVATPKSFTQRLARESAMSAAVSVVSHKIPSTSRKFEQAVRVEQERQQADLFRHIFGPPLSVPSSLPSAVCELAESVYRGENASFVLHDALLEAGHADLAAHFREPYHPKGCWALDLILGKA
jgi:hypothetical protein